MQRRRSQMSCSCCRRSSTPLMLRLLLCLVISCSLHRRRHVVSAEKDSNPYAWGENPNKSFRMYWHDARNVIQDLGKFQALYVKYHGCVWSECSVDSYDDDGENRDGDEYWYQYRTQPFCANAAYSLYGVLKGRFSVFNSCTKGTYINSFFTYGGADTLLSALDISTSTVFDDYSYDDDDGSYTYSNSNAICYEIDGEDGNNNNNYDDDRMNGMSSTMGCTRDGSFAVATFQGDYCDGNYFLETTDYLRQYNRNINGVRCRQIWNLRRDGNTLDQGDDQYQRKLEDQGDDDNYYYTPKSAAEALLMNSWACNTDIYGSGCPDPYGLKSKYNSILSAVSSGQSPRLAIANARLKTPLRVLSWMAFLAATFLLMASYYVKNKERIQAQKLGPVLWEDFKYSCGMLPGAIARACRNCRKIFRHFREIRRKRKKAEKSSKKHKKDKDKKKKKRKKHRKRQEEADNSEAFGMSEIDESRFSSDPGASPSSVDRYPSLTESQSSKSSWW